MRLTPQQRLTERTRRAIGAAVVRCIYCGHALSFRDNRPFCRKCRAFNIIMEGGKTNESV